MKGLSRFFMVILMCVGMGLSAHAQVMGAPEFMRGKLITGGNLGAGLSGSYLHVGVAPLFGYRITRSLEAGVRLGYDMHVYFQYNSPYLTHILSGAAYANFEIFRGFYIHGEYEKQLKMHSGGDVTQDAKPTWYTRIPVGLGYRQYLSESQFFYTSFLYDLNWDYYNSLYSNPFVIKVGYCYCF